MRLKIEEALNKGDGVFIRAGLSVNGYTYYYIEVYKGGKVVEKSKEYWPRYGLNDYANDVYDKAEELADKYDLEIYDATDLQFSTFGGHYFIDTHRYDNKEKFASRGAKGVEFTDQDIWDVDDRPVQYAKWAICTSPGEFDIYDRVTKNPGNKFTVHSVNMNNSEKIDDMIKFFKKNTDKVYKGTWDDIKDEEYSIIVNNRFYTSNDIKDIFNRALKADLKINDKRIQGQIVLGTKRDYYGDEVEDIVSFKYHSSQLFWNDNVKDLSKNLTLIYDAFTCADKYFPDEFYLTNNEEKEDIYDAYLVKIIKNTPQILDKTTFNKANNLKVGDIIQEVSLFSSSSFETPYYVVTDIDKEKGKFTYGYCSKTTRDIWSTRYYVDEELAKEVLKGKYKDQLKTMNLYSDRYIKTRYHVDL